MSNLSWNEIQDRADEFASKWHGEVYEKGESQSFWSDFLHIFGVDRRRHGGVIDGYAAKLDTYASKMAAMQHKIDRLEKYIQILAQKTGVDLDAIYI
ncbi:hypothetical protein FJZ39_01320 [Candidatus Saccharibacteria bacterium]|nr:hypothetical protein [Candidatus Saccharibacteria bacterium]